MNNKMIIAFLALTAQPDISARGWNKALSTYKESRAPDHHYSMDTHKRAVELFREGIAEEHDKRTVHHSGVRLAWETIMMTNMYCTTSRK